MRLTPFLYKMKQMSAKYSHTKPKKGYTLECLTTANGTKYQRLIRNRAEPSGKVICYIHGGCYISGLTYNYRDFCAPFCDLSDGAEIIFHRMADLQSASAAWSV